MLKILGLSVVMGLSMLMGYWGAVAMQRAHHNIVNVSV